MRAPKDPVLVAKLRADLTTFHQQHFALDGIQTPAAMDCLLLQIEDSIRRIQYVKTVASKPHHANAANPHLAGFNPLNAAAYHLANGNIDEAAWLVFLATHFGKNLRTEWKLVQAVYGGLGGQIWDWPSVCAAPNLIGQWIDANQLQLKAQGNFSNHRKYESLKYRITGGAINSYVDWIGPNHSHILKFAQIEPAHATPKTRFKAFYRATRELYRFARMGQFDLLTMMGKMAIADIEPDSVYMQGASGPVTGAKLLFANDKNANISRVVLEQRLGQLEAHLGLTFGMQVLEDALCNWQKSQSHYRYFKG